jgi:hypothetical protein
MLTPPVYLGADISKPTINDSFTHTGRVVRAWSFTGLIGFIFVSLLLLPVLNCLNFLPS